MILMPPGILDLHLDETLVLKHGLIKKTLLDRPSRTCEFDPAFGVQSIHLLFGIHPVPSFGWPGVMPLIGKATAFAWAGKIGAAVNPTSTLIDI